MLIKNDKKYKLSILLLLLLIGCSYSYQNKKNSIKIKRGLFIFYGHSDSESTDLFIEGNFLPKNYLKILENKKTIKAEFFFLNLKERYDIISRSDTLLNNDDYTPYTFGEKEIYFYPCKITYEKGEKLEDPFSPNLNVKVKFRKEIIIDYYYTSSKILKITPIF